MWAHRLAEARYPSKELTDHAGDRAEFERRSKERLDFYTARREAARAAVARRYRIDDRDVKEIEEQGQDATWRLSEKTTLFDPRWVKPPPAAKKGGAQRARSRR
jgi:hypothetical protein